MALKTSIHRSTIHQPHEYLLPQVAAETRSDPSAGAALSEPALRALRAHLSQDKPVLRSLRKNGEKSFLKSFHEAGKLQACQQQRQVGLEALCSRQVYVGSEEVPKTWSHLGWLRDHPDWSLSLSRDQGGVWLASGIPGFGKTVLSTLIGEGSFVPGLPLASAQLLPTAYVFFHIEENDRLPQLLDGLKENPKPADLQLLMQRLGMSGRGLTRLRLVLPHWMMKDQALMRKLRPYRDLGLQVVELRVHLREIGQPGLEAAIGAQDAPRFVQRLLEEAQNLGDKLTTQALEEFLDSEKADDLDINAKRKARKRLSVLKEIEVQEQGAPGIWKLFEPGWATVVYLGGPHMGWGKVSPILVSLLSGLMMPCPQYGEFQRVIAVDEINLIDKDDPVWTMLVHGARLARHRGWLLMLLGQDMFCVPDEMFSAVGVCAVFRQSSPKAWEHLRDRVGPLRNFRWEDVGHQEQAEAVLTALLNTGGQQAYRVRFRPPLCMHGGFTRGAI